MQLYLLLIFAWFQSCILATTSNAPPLAFVQPGSHHQAIAQSSQVRRAPRKLPPNIPPQVQQESKAPRISLGPTSSALFMAAVSENDFYKGKDCYEVLEIPRSADAKEIKSAYRKAIAKWHPDKFPDDEAKRKEGGIRMEAINRAWYCLGDEDRRRRYDQYGEAGVGTSYVHN